MMPQFMFFVVLPLVLNAAGAIMVIKTILPLEQKKEKITQLFVVLISTICFTFGFTRSISIAGLAVALVWYFACRSQALALHQKHLKGEPK